MSKQTRKTASKSRSRKKRSRRKRSHWTYERFMMLVVVYCLLFNSVIVEALLLFLSFLSLILAYSLRMIAAYILLTRVLPGSKPARYLVLTAFAVNLILLFLFLNILMFMG